MALKKDITLNDQEYKGCYISFEHMLFEGKVEDTGNRNVRAVLFAREMKGDDRVICFYDCNFVYDLSSSDNLWKQSYEAAKLLPELSDAEDV